MRHGWQCDSCGKVDSKQPWNCPTCGKEVCEYCFERYAHCKECSQKALRTLDLIRRANAHGWDFDEVI
jgi:hypothetical protein